MILFRRRASSTAAEMAAAQVAVGQAEKEAPPSHAADLHMGQPPYYCTHRRSVIFFGPASGQGLAL